MDLWEKLLWIGALLGVVAIPVLNATVKESYLQDQDIQVEEVHNWKAQEEALRSVLKYIRSPKERQAFLQQIEAAKKRRTTSSAKSSSPTSAARRPTRPTSSGVPWIREDSSHYGYLPPNTTVKIVSADFKMKYASSLKETFQVLRQAGSRFVKTAEGPRPVITWVNPGTIIYRLGFRPGDVILRVNGRPVNGVRAAKDLYYALKNDREYLVEVLRQGKVHRFIFKVED